jgi:hypothetical protein
VTHLTIRRPYNLLNDNNEKIREAAANYVLHLEQPLNRQMTLLAATATSRAFAEHPAPVLHTLTRATGELPSQALDLCKHWLNRNFKSAGDIQTAAAADAYYAVRSSSPFTHEQRSAAPNAYNASR